MPDTGLLYAALFFAWAVFSIAMALGGAPFPAAKWLTKTLYNARISLNNWQPFKLYISACRSKRYLFVFLWALCRGLATAGLYYWLGSIKLGLAFLVLQPLAQGILAGAGEPKTRLYAAFTALFSLTALVLCCCLGAMAKPALLWLPALLLTANAGWVTLGMHIGAEGVPGVDAIAAQAYRS